jgi:NADPH:quinone reductase-like Zn-dependent oxidoreductase
MKAMTCKRYGLADVLTLAEVPEPLPKKSEIKVKIMATTVTSMDCGIRSFNIPDFVLWLSARLLIGLRGPRNNILGAEFAGEVVEVGHSVTRFKKGDLVTGYSSLNNGFGAYAEYICIDEGGLLFTNQKI